MVKTVSKRRVYLIVTAITSIGCCTLLLHYFPKQVWPLSNNSMFQISPPKDETTKSSRNLERESYVQIHPFDMRGNDVMVFLHIPKTSGGHFSKQLVTNLQLERACIPPVEG